MDKRRVEEIKKKIDDLKSRLPAHSIPPRMLEELDELEDELTAPEAGVERVGADVPVRPGGGTGQSSK